MDWRAAAKCLGDDPSRYELGGRAHFPGVADRDLFAAQQAAARVLCAGCPVIAECARDALRPLSIGMVRGGVYVPDLPTKSTRDRARVRLQRAAGEVVEYV